jgi:hypothetical protein
MSTLIPEYINRTIIEIFVNADLMIRSLFAFTTIFIFLMMLTMEQAKKTSALDV